MKQSIYNFIYNSNNDFVIYNSFTGAVALLNNYEKDCYEKMSFTDSELIEKLHYGGFIIEDSYDELAFMKMNFLRKRYSENTLSMCIAPTLNCNFRCSYCFENNIRSSGSISEDTMKCIFSYLKDNIENIKELIVTWYGGEPLLEIDKIVYMSEKMMEICEDNDVEYHSTMITNGYLLNEINVDKLNKCKIENIQVTLDGNKFWHNKKRYLVNGNGTYDVILNNIKKNYKKLPFINIRINADKNNIKYIYEVINNLENFTEKIFFNIAKVNNNNSTYTDKMCLSDAEYFEKIMENQFRDYRDKIENLLNPCKTYFCNAQLYNTLVIDNRGYLYKCWTDIGYTNRAFGNINNVKSLDINKFSEYFNIDPFDDSECNRCKYLPLCLGGCPYQYKNRKSRECTFIKDRLEEILISTLI